MILSIANCVFFLGMVYINYLANAKPINGYSTGAISDRYPNLFTPAGLTFSIWGVIYLLLLAFLVLQFTKYGEDIVEIVNWIFIPSCIFNGIWIFAWHYLKVFLSLLIMLCLLGTLIYLNMQFVEKDYSIAKIVFGMYLGWICIATIANVTCLLVDYQWKAWGISPTVWTILVIIVGATIATVTVKRLKNSFIAASVVWAFLGIVIKRSKDNTPITITAILGMIVVGGLSVMFHLKKQPEWLDC